MRQVCLIETDRLDELVADAEANECRAVRDSQAGTVIVWDGDITVIKAVQKGRGQPWIAVFHDSPRITWSK